MKFSSLAFTVCIAISGVATSAAFAQPAPMPMAAPAPAPMPLGQPIAPNDPNGVYCREYTQPVVIGGVHRTSYGTACQQPDGAWKIISNDVQQQAPTQAVQYVAPPQYVGPPQYVLPPQAYYQPYPYYTPYPFVGEVDIGIGHGGYYHGGGGYYHGGGYYRH